MKKKMLKFLNEKVFLIKYIINHHRFGINENQQSNGNYFLQSKNKTIKLRILFHI